MVFVAVDLLLHNGYSESTRKIYLFIYLFSDCNRRRK